MSVSKQDLAERAEPSAGGLTVRSIVLPNRIRLEYVEHGDRAGVPVLLLHGLADSWRSFERLLPNLPASIRAFALTQRGHGDADRPAAGYGPRDFAADLAAFMDVLGLRRAVVVGHSLSTIVAQRFALDHPARTLGLVLVSWRGYPRASVAAVLTALTDPIDPAFVRQFLVASFTQAPPEAVLDAMVRESLKVPARVWQAVVDDFRVDDVSAELDMIAVPALVVWGDQDATCPRPEQEALATTMVDARLVVYHGAGHALHWEHPARFATDLAAFVEQLSVS